MSKTRIVSAAAILLLIGLSTAFPSRGQITPQPTQKQTVLKPLPPPAPVITAWGPKDKVATGETIWIQGTNLQRDILVVTLGDRAILPHLYFEMLPVSTSAATRFEFRTTTAMKTGVQTSTPLKVLHRGGAPVTLDADYHVVDRLARFSGISQYHKGVTAAFGIYSEGSVQIDLNNLDFMNEGSGTYKEQIRLIRRVRETTEPCPAPFQLLKKTITFYDFAPVSSQRPITWKRDPTLSTRIILYGIGPVGPQTVTADVTPDFRIQCGYADYVSVYGPHKSESGCPGGLDNALTTEGERLGGPRVQLVPAQQPPPLRPAPPTFIVYALRRAI